MKKKKAFSKGPKSMPPQALRNAKVAGPSEVQAAGMQKKSAKVKNRRPRNKGRT